MYSSFLFSVSFGGNGRGECHAQWFCGGHAVGKKEGRGGSGFRLGFFVLLLVAGLAVFAAAQLWMALRSYDSYDIKNSVDQGDKSAVQFGTFCGNVIEYSNDGAVYMYGNGELIWNQAFEMASRKIQEYPHCDLLIYTIATVLNGSLTLSDLNDEERMEYNTAIIEWLERTADSQDERVRNSSVFILATKYVQMEKYEEANALLKKIPDTVIDATIMKTSVLAHQEGTDTAALFLEGKLLQAVINIQSYLYKLIEMEEETGNHDKAEKIAEITDHMISLFGLWNYGNTVPYLLIAGYRKNVEKCVQLIKQLLSESQKPWNMTQSPLYYRYEDTAQGKAFSGLGKNFVRELYSEIENKKEYEFLRGNKELESIFEEHLK